MIVAVDLDEVLGNYLDAFLAFYNEKHGTTRIREEFTSYRFWETLGGTIEEFNILCDEFTLTAHFQEMEPIEEALHAIRALSKEHELVLITARPQKLEQQTRVWLEQHFPGIFRRVHLTNQFARLGYWQSKADICREVGAGVIIEDNLDYASECAEKGTPALLVDRPWNQADDLPLDVRRVHDWGEILEILTTGGS